MSSELPCLVEFLLTLTHATLQADKSRSNGKEQVFVTLRIDAKGLPSPMSVRSEEKQTLFCDHLPPVVLLLSIPLDYPENPPRSLTWNTHQVVRVKGTTHMHASVNPSGLTANSTNTLQIRPQVHLALIASAFSSMPRVG